MICYRVKNGLDFCNINYAKRWIQRVVLINKSDVAAELRGGNVISFALAEGAKGYAFNYGKIADSVMGNCETVTKFDYAQFRHNVQVPFVSFMNNSLLIDLARGECFAALLDGANRVWIFGYDYTLKAQDSLINHIAIDILTLRSEESGLEDVPPMRFYSDDPVRDFYNDFKDILAPSLGEFSDDFSDDFNNLGDDV